MRCNCLTIGCLLMITMTALLAVGCLGNSDAGGRKEEIMLATTTSTDDTGLLQEIIPKFEQDTGYQVRVMAMGTGQALEVGKRGDADLLLVHAKRLEEEFISEGFGSERIPIMSNKFVLVGPKDFPDEIYQADTLKEVLHKIYTGGEDNDKEFLSRGDESGTYLRERQLWQDFQLTPDSDNKDWYRSLGQGMGDTLVAANEMEGYTLADKGTYLAMEEKLPNLDIVFQGSDKLHNPYSLILLSDEEFPRVNHSGAEELAQFFQREEIQEQIGEFGTIEYGEPLFTPANN